jgi:hypothetical protein
VQGFAEYQRQLHVQGFAEYQRRLQATLADVMQPPAFTGRLAEATSLLPDFSATFAALSERMAMPPLPRLRSMVALRDPDTADEAARSDSSLPRSASVRLPAQPPASCHARMEWHPAQAQES